MPKFKLVIEYDGTPFVGWQSQANGLSVQDCVEQAIERYCGERPRIQGAGRTDAGVHALGQVADVTLGHNHPSETVMNALNFHLKPHPIAVLSAEQVADDFSARFSAIRRHYRYRIANRRAALTLDKERAWLVPQPLDADTMNEAAQCLIGRHDFTTFRSAQCQAKSPVKTIDRIHIERDGNAIALSISARSFLHNQVRSIMGSLKMVGDGSWSAGTIQASLEARDRSQCGPVAPAHGLYLVKVDYAD